MNEIQFEGKLINRRWKILNLIGSGSFGKVFLVWDNELEEYFAMKVEENKNDDKLKTESKIMLALNSKDRKKTGIAFMHWYGTDSNFSQLNFMVNDLLGPSLEELFLLCNRKFSLKTVLIIADSTLSLLEYVHQKSYIHRDVKPENFLLGINTNSHLIHLIDFGLSQRYRDPDTYCHISFKENRPLVGTARYMSINNHIGIEASRRDDLESLGYMLIYFLNGSLPWQGIGIPNKREKYGTIKDKKMKTLVESYCSNLPPEFTIFLNYTRSLNFDEMPDYQVLKKMFSDLLKRRGYVNDYKYDWTDPKLINMDLINKKDLPFDYDPNTNDSESKSDSKSINSSNEVSSDQKDSFIGSSDSENSQDGNIKLNTEQEKEQLNDSVETNNQPMYANKKIKNLQTQGKGSIFMKMKDNKDKINSNIDEKNYLENDDNKIERGLIIQNTSRETDNKQSSNDDSFQSSLSDKSDV